MQDTLTTLELPIAVFMLLYVCRDGGKLGCFRRNREKLICGKNVCVFAEFKFSHLIFKTLLRQEFYPLSILVESQAVSVVMCSRWDSGGIRWQPSGFLNPSSCMPSRVARVQVNPLGSSLGRNPSGVLKLRLLGTLLAVHSFAIWVILFLQSACLSWVM